MIKLYSAAAGLLLSSAFSAAAQGTLYVDAGTKGHDINPGMYGIFFEEINHSGDGGLYAELLQNRGFEEQVIPGGFNKISEFKIQSDKVTEMWSHRPETQLTLDWDFAQKKMTGWKIDSEGCSVSHDVVT
ncbi:MAG: hypothetical protein K2I92_03170, partial [Muribaculaceae bacterium]|nr:hypothetical protein [Muribaculaceae bacterium]